MIRVAVLAITLTLLIAGSVRAQDSPRLLKTLNAVGCCELDLELSLLAEALSVEPHSQLFVIGYGGPRDAPGKVLRYLEYIKRELPSALGKDSYPITVLHGGRRDQFGIDLWIGQKDSAQSFLEGPRWSPDYSAPFKFDELSVSIIDWPDGTSRLSFGELCTLTYPDWAAVFSMLRSHPGSTAHIFVYGRSLEISKEGRRLIRFLKAELTESFTNQSVLITQSYGGKSKKDWPEIEVWFTPAGGKELRPVLKTEKPVK
jgi:hypothetical protein